MRLLLGLAVLGLLGCGAGGVGGGGSATPETSLRITVWPRGEAAGGARTWTLACGPVGGTHPQRRAACARLRGLESPFRPTPGDAVCTQQYGGPTEALVTGRLGGRRISARFHRRDGCGIARWRAHAFLFPIRPVSP